MFFAPVDSMQSRVEMTVRSPAFYGGLTVVVGYGGVLFPEGYIVEITAH